MEPLSRDTLEDTPNMIGPHPPRNPEAAETNLVDLSQNSTEKCSTFGKLVSHEIRIRIMERVEQHQEEFGRMGQGLNVD